MKERDRKKLADEKKRLKTYQAKIKKDLEGPVTRVQFQNLEGLEQEKVPLEFTYENVQKYVLINDGVYDLPDCVIDSLRRRCKVPVYKQYDQAEVQGDLRPTPIDPQKRIQGYRQRFALVPVAAA